MTEYQLISNFNLFLISNAMFQLGVFVLLWAALRGSLRIYDQGANIATKIRRTYSQGNTAEASALAIARVKQRCAHVADKPTPNNHNQVYP